MQYSLRQVLANNIFPHLSVAISIPKLMSNLLLVCFAYQVCATSGDIDDTQNRLAKNSGLTASFREKIPLMEMPFIKNVGQKNETVAFFAPTFGGTLFVSKKGELIYTLPKRQNTNQDSAGVVLKETIVGLDIKKIVGQASAPTKVNFFIGNDPSKWHRNIETFQTLNLGEILPGINLQLHAYGNNIEKLFIVAPDAEPARILMRIEGAGGLKLDRNGQLVVVTGLGPVVFTKPLAYQQIDGEKHYVEASYILKTGEGSKLVDHYGFHLGPYDRNYPLTIDPLLASTFMGGMDEDFAYDMVLDSDSNVYLTGSTASSDFPTSNGVYDASFNTSDDVFVAKLDSTLNTLMAATFIGGSLWERAYVIALDSSNNVYIAGETVSSGYPITAGAYSSCCNPYDFFVTKLTSDLSVLVASTRLGGGNIGSSVRAMLLDSENNVYLLGDTLSDQFPTTLGAYDGSYDGLQDIFVAKMDSDLSSLSAATYLGGTSTERPYAMDLDSNGNVLITGHTASSDFPTTGTPYDDTFDGGDNVFVSKLDGNLSNLLGSTFLGGSSAFAYGIAVDSANNVFVGGWTFSDDFPTTPSAYDSTYNGQDDVFVSKLDPNLGTLIASTFLGGSISDRLHDLVLDSSNNVYLIGHTSSADFPTSAGAYDSSYNGSSDVFISKLSSTLDTLVASTYLGGTDSESASSGRDFFSIVVDNNANSYVAGWTESTDFPTTAEVFDESYNGTIDAFLAKLTLESEHRLYVANPGSNITQQTFLRFINPNSTSASVEVFGTDDAGVLSSNDPISLTLAPESAIQFNAQDLENGNSNKGLTSSLGNGQGKWQLRIKSDNYLKIMGLIRTPDGFLTSLNDTVPKSGNNNLVYFANPASNVTQQTFLRIVNTTAVAGTVTITAIDDAGLEAPGTISFFLMANESKQINAQELEAGSAIKGLTGSLGNGTGKWRLVVASPLNLEVMSLIRTPDGFLTNLSGMVDQKANGDFIAYFGNPASEIDRQTFLRIINTSNETGNITIIGLDDTGLLSPAGEVMFQLGPNESKQINAQDLETGNVNKGLVGMLGDGNGRWIYAVIADISIQVMSLVRTPDGFLTNLSRVTPITGKVNDVFFFNPASNVNQVSSLRLVNLSSISGDVTISGIDDNGAVAPGGDVSINIPANSAIEITSQDLENGNVLLGLVGSLGNGSGKWRLEVTSDLELKVLGLMNTPSGFLTNISRAAE